MQGGQADGGQGQPALPHNEEAEQALLGAIFISNEVMDRLGDTLAPDDFYFEVHGRIFEASQRLIEKGGVANPVTLKTVLAEDEMLAQLGGPAYLMDLATSAATTINAPVYAAEIVELARKRRIVEISEGAIDAALDPEMESHSTLAFTIGALDSVSEADRTRNNVRKAGDVMMDAVRFAEDASHSRVKVLSTGIRPLDEALGGGLRPQQLVVEAGATGMGKTSLALSISKNLSLRGYHGAFFSGEMGAQANNPEIGIKLLSQLSGIETDTIMKGNDFVAVEALVQAQARFAKLPLIIDDNGGVSAAYIAAKARSMKRRWGGKLDFLVVDYLQIMDHSGDGRNDNRTVQIGHTTMKLKRLAKELDCPIILLSQLSREVEKRPDKRPVLADLRESGSIEQDADVVLFVFREHYYLQRQEKDTNAPDYEDFRQRLFDTTDKAEVIVAKARMGRVQRVECRFHGPTQTFHDGNYEYARR